MIYEIRATQGDEYAEWYVEAPAHRKGRVPDALRAHAQHLVIHWCEIGENMAPACVEIAEYLPARVGYRSSNTHAMTISGLCEWTAWSEAEWEMNKRIARAWREHAAQA